MTVVVIGHPPLRIVVGAIQWIVSAEAALNILFHAKTYFLTLTSKRWSHFWPRLALEPLAPRRAFDCRIALALLHAGVTEFATENIKDFDGFGFSRIWNPL